jgi:Cu(I)/Ag(I) efflux system membrane protein CusA/SilA
LSVLSRVIGFSARHPALVLAATAVLGVWAFQLLGTVPLDALPDLSDTQVIIQARWERSPDVLEDQLTFPLVSALLGMPRVRAVRGLTDFGTVFVYAIFEDGTDLYWARSRVLERMGEIRARLPAGAEVSLGPDATGLGWVYQYALVDRQGRHGPEELRAFQDWTLRYALQGVPGVAEVASLGGFVRQVQVRVDPGRLQAFDVSLEQVVQAVRGANDESGARLLEMGGREVMVRLRGYAQGPEDFARAVVRAGPGGVPVRVGDLAEVGWGPELRRGVADLDGLGDHVGGIVVMRQGENALRVIERVVERLGELTPSLPAGVEVVTTYDRSELIRAAVRTLTGELVLEMILVALIILVFLWHIPSALVPIVTLPVSVLLAFIPLHLMGVTVNIMSLAGIAISIGVLVDGAIVEVENAYNRIHRWMADGRQGDFHEIRLQALQEVGPAVFFSLLIIAVSFLPVFVLVDQEGRLFKPLAYSKTLAMAFAAVLAVTLDPALRMLFSRVEPFRFSPRPAAWLANQVLVGSYRAEEDHPITRRLQRLYEPVLRRFLRRPWLVLGGALILLGASVPAYLALGSEFMPPLREGTILYMPTTLPGLSSAEAQELLTRQDRALMNVPEVVRVHGKAGRAETATDPAPFSMMETVIVLQPQERWRPKERWYTGILPAFLQPLVRPFWPDRLSYDELLDELDRALAIPGVTNAWTMPIKARIDMLSTGMRTPVGVKVLGDDPEVIERVGEAVAAALRAVPGTRSVFAERPEGGLYLDIEPDREALARYGLSIDELHRTLMAAVGGENVGTLVEGRRRFPVNVRYPRELRDDPDLLGRVLVATSTGVQVPLHELAELRLVQGPAMLRTEDGFLAGYVYVDVTGRDLGSYVEEARRRVADQVSLPVGTVLLWSGQVEGMLRVREHLMLLLPITLVLILLLLYLNTRSSFKTMLVLLAVPFSAIGAVWLFWLLGYHVSVAAWVGLIALLGLDAETGVFMLLFLDQSLTRARREGRLSTSAELDEALVNGAVRRLRPKLMTVLTAVLGLLPILWSQGAGADVMKRIAAPMIGGLVTSFLAELLLYPAAYKLWLRRGGALSGRVTPVP